MSRKTHKTPSGVALLMVVLVLAMLTIVGVLFSLTVSVHLKTNIQYRERAEVRNAGLSALYRFTSELMYNVWGTNEMRAFTCADGTPLGVPLGTAVGKYSFGTYAGDPTDPLNPPTAYYKSRTDPAGETDVEVLDRPWSRYTQSVVNLPHGNKVAVWEGWPYHHREKNNVIAGMKQTGNENDYRWMVSSDVWGGENAGILADRLLDARLNSDGTPRAVGAGGLYHDEFLPTGLSNADCFELALHYNNGTVFGREPRYGFNRVVYGNTDLTFYNDGHSSGFYCGLGKWFRKNYHWYSTPQNVGSHANAYWDRVMQDGHRCGYNSANWFFDPIDIRMTGNSFYRIFHYDLIDPQDFKVRGTGVDPDLPARYYSEDEIYSRTDYAKDGEGNRVIRATHLGDATNGDGVTGHQYTAGTYTDVLGNALNINQVNLNYAYEEYPGMWGANDTAAEDFRHYNESKWIYLYDEDDPEMPAWARYALYVWPDCGLLNANAITNDGKFLWGTGGNTTRTLRTGMPSSQLHAMMLKLLDNGVGESGELRGDVTGGRNGNKDTGEVERWDHSYMMGQLAFGKVKGAAAPSSYDSLLGSALEALSAHKWKEGAFGSRAEIEVVWRKKVMGDTDAELTARAFSSAAYQKTLGGTPLADLTPEDMRLHDAELIGYYFTPHSYEYLLDPHWEQDRPIFDGFSMADWELHNHGTGASAERNGKRGGSPYLPGGYRGVYNDAAAVAARQRICDTLASLKDYYGVHSVEINGGAADSPAQPGTPLPPFAENYSQVHGELDSYAFIGPFQAKKAKAKFLCDLLNAHYPVTDLWEHSAERAVFTIDPDDPAAPPKINLSPKQLLFDYGTQGTAKHFVLGRADRLCISEVGCGLFTVPIGPKLLDPDFEDPLRARLLTTRVDDDDHVSGHVMMPGVPTQDPDFKYRYAFEQKRMNFIELTSTQTVSTLSSRWFLRVYGNVRNWEGKCKDEDGNDVAPQRYENGGSGYIDLFAKVKSVKVSDGVDANGDGDFVDAGDTPPVYTVDTAAKGWDGDTYYDPDHYIEGVTIRYRGTTASGNRDKAGSDGWFTDTNGDKSYSNDRDWKAEYNAALPKDAQGRSPLLDGGRFMKPEIIIGESTPDVLFEDGKYYDRRSGKHLINPTGTVGDNLADEDWGSPRINNHGGSRTPDTKIDGTSSHYEDEQVFWSSGGGEGVFEDLADWITAGKYRKEEEAKDAGTFSDPTIDDRYSGRDWGQIRTYHRPDYGNTHYRFGSWQPYYAYDGGPTSDELRLEVKLGDPDSGLEHFGAPEIDTATYIMVIFPQALTPWTRRGNALEAQGLSDEEKRNKYGLSHFDDTTKYPDVTDTSPRTSNYADGDAVVLGYYASTDSYRRFALGQAQSQYENQPRVTNYVVLNGQHPDLAAAGGAAGPACAFSRTGATISGGTFIVDDAGSPQKEDCVETLPGGRTESFPSELGHGFSVRDLRDNQDPWGWDATYWDWNAKAPPAPNPAVPYTCNPQTPALTSYDDRKVPWATQSWGFCSVAKMWEQTPGDGLGIGRFNRHVHGRGASSIFTQMDEGDPAAEDPTATDTVTFDLGGASFVEPHMRLYPDYRDCNYDGSLDDVTQAKALSPAGAGAASGRYPFPICGHTAARPSKSLAARQLDGELTAWIYEGVGEGDLESYQWGQGRTPTFFRDRLWMHHAVLGTGDMRMRGWNDLSHSARVDEYFDSDSMSPWYGMLSCAVSPIRDMLDTDSTGASESKAEANYGYTTTPLWSKKWSGGAFSDSNYTGRFWADRKTIKRTNINEIVVPAVLNGVLLDMGVTAAYNPIKETSGYFAQGTPSLVPMTFLGHKPPRGYPYLNEWRKRATAHGAQRDNMLWRKNLWADASFDTMTDDRDIREGVNRKLETGWASAATVAPSPVYTAYILVQRLDFDGQPLCEQKLRVTVERTWDGKLNILDYRVTPRE